MEIARDNFVFLAHWHPLKKSLCRSKSEQEGAAGGRSEVYNCCYKILGAIKKVPFSLHFYN